ncbi:hypothetical protein ACFV84_37340 [Kitasatospora sp. NPDC059811]|uniref:hypothetical protein n=1 Tax=unclassified Kitasatospora TaxID=2633591 RepID=UPI00362F65A4
MAKRMGLVSATVMLAVSAALVGPAVGTAAATSRTVTDVTNEATWRPGTQFGNTVQIHRYTKSDGHNYVDSWLQALDGNTVAYYYDRSYNGGKTWDSFVNRIYTQTGASLPEKYDDGGVWYRACGASEWLGSPYTNPQWTYNIACTGWY